MQRLVFLILLAGSAIAVSPMDAPSKAATSATAAIAGFFSVGQSRKGKEERKDALTQGERELATSIRKFTKEKDEFREEKGKLQQDWEAIAELKAELELQKRLAERELKLTEEQFLVETEKREAQSKRDIERARREAAKRLWKVHDHLWRLRRTIAAQVDERVRVESERAIAQLKAQAELEIEQLKQELEVKIAEAEQARLDAQQELDEEHAAMQEGLNETIEQAKALLRQQLEDDKKAWMVRHVEAYNAKCKELDSAKTRIRLLREEMADMQDIKLCKETGTAHGDRANIVLIWLKQHGIYANWVFSSIPPSGVFQLGFDFWVEDPKTVAKVEKLMPLLQNKLGSADIPTLGHSKHSRCWVITALPCVAETRPNLNDLYKRSVDIDVPSTFGDLEPHLRDAIAAELSYQQQEQEIKTLIPPVPLPRPNTHAISWLEIACLKHYMYYRAEATKGAEPNVTTKAELMEIVYGVKKGYSSQRRDPILDESLSQRYDRAMRLIEGEAIAHE
jgi:hypothetical protein